MKHVTIKDIARHLSISVSTVSRALVNDKNIRKETKEMVLEAAKTLGYKPNPIALTLKKGHTDMVGVIVPELITPFAARVISGIQSVLYDQGIKVIIADSQESHEEERENLLMMERFMVDGIIVSLCSYENNGEIYRKLLKNGMPIVFYDRIPYGLDVSKVVVDDYMKTFFLIEKLIRGGNRNIAHIEGPDDMYNSIERSRAYKDALEKFHIPFDKRMVVKSPTSYEGGAKAADELLSRHLDIDVIFAFSDIVAIGAKNRLQELGLKIPEDIGIASFSGTKLSEIVNPKLTTVEPDLESMGREAAKLIVDKIKNPQAPIRTITVDANIILRESTKLVNTD